MEETIIFHELGKDPMFKTWHALNRHMLIYIHAGEGGIVCQEKTYPIKKGVLCFVGMGKFHYTMPDIPEEYDRSKLFIDTGVFENMLRMFPDTGMLRKFSKEAFIFAQVDEEENAIIEQIFSDMKKYENQECYSSMSMVAGCIKLLMLTDKYSVESAGSASGTMNHAIEYINNNIFSDINIDEICAAVHMSKYHFCRQFKKHTGMTVMNYILNTRIVLAKHMLTNAKVSVTEVSESCGFSSVSYFSSAFKNSTGLTPREFRKNYTSYPVL